jgi:hypothetical protein
MKLIEESKEIIKRGDYNDHRILKVLCKKCHGLYHGNEFNQVRSR